VAASQSGRCTVSAMAGVGRSRHSGPVARDFAVERQLPTPACDRGLRSRRHFGSDARYCRDHRGDRLSALRHDRKAAAERPASRACRRRGYAARARGRPPDRERRCIARDHRRAGRRYHGSDVRPHRTVARRNRRAGPVGQRHRPSPEAGPAASACTGSCRVCVSSSIGSSRRDPPARSLRCSCARAGSRNASTTSITPWSKCGNAVAYCRKSCI